MNYWLMKSEPNVWSIDQQKKAREDKATQVKEVPGWEYYYTAPCPDMFKNLKK